MIRRPPSTTRTATPCPYTTLFRSLGSPRPGLVPGHAAPVAILGLRLCVDVVHRRGRDARPAPRRARTLNGMFVTGTDTGVGKTLASCTLLHALRARGLRAVGMKPLASGRDAPPDGLRNEDALALLAASDPRDRQRVASGKSVSVRVELGGPRIIQTEKKYTPPH